MVVYAFAKLVRQIGCLLVVVALILGCHLALHHGAVLHLWSCLMGGCLLGSSLCDVSQIGNCHIGASLDVLT